MKRFIIISALFTALLGFSSCIKEAFDFGEFAPEGSDVTMYIHFGADQQGDIHIGTKSESSRVDESNVHDLFVMIFNEAGSRIYARYFTYEHLITKISDLNTQANEGWYVSNVTIDNIASGTQTRGIVKISTIATEHCTLVVLANLSSTIFSLDGEDPATRLMDITELEDLSAVKVSLKQNTVDRGNQFLRLGIRRDINTGNLSWGTLANNNPTYNETVDGEGNPVAPSANSQVVLEALDAKIKFRIKQNPENISNITPRYWQACQIPEGGQLFPNDVTRDEQIFFNAQEAYFEGTEVERDPEHPDDASLYTIYHVFCFYMLENRQTPLRSVSTYAGSEFTNNKYYLRELQEKLPDTDPSHPAGSVVNGDWVYARPEASYVKFELVLTLTESGIRKLDPSEVDKTAALTSEAVFRVHLGDFGTSNNTDETRFDDYNVKRGYCYTYDITVDNSKSIYVEVRGEKQGGQTVITENEPGHEGSLLLTTDGIINCDAHYEYHSLDFRYNNALGADTYDSTLDTWPERSKVSWYVKTPFFNGGGIFDSTTGLYNMPDPNDPANKDVHPDYQWILFALNNKEGGKYKTARRAYPGIDDDTRRDYYQPGWVPDPAHPKDVPVLMDINQLINFMFVQNMVHHDHPENSLFAQEDDGYHIRLTAYINEYYYERDPRTYTQDKENKPFATDPSSGKLNANLWREFVNAKPRELHILSNTQVSADRKSDVIVSSHSIIQESIQTIYNIYAPDLTSLWGVEHKDEMSAKARSKVDFEKDGWPWSGGAAPSGQVIPQDEENGRYNSACLWGLSSESSAQLWNDFLDFEGENDTPELKSTRYYQMYSCMTRNRDNNGNGYIDPDELRWYTASVNQLVGMWVGNESLSLKARLYQPVDPYNRNGTDPNNAARWRSTVLSSTYAPNPDKNNTIEPRIIRAEEAATKSFYSTMFSYFTAAIRDKSASVRCLRNIGTYNDHGDQKDITEAPYDQMFDQYYDFKAGQDKNGKAWPNDDGTYTINFTRLNMKSVRAYTESDLPYHEEYSTNNMVYLRFTAQAPSEAIKVDGTNVGTQKSFNDAVSIHNTFCPPGYRVPNMTELLMMTALLPESYWHKNNDISIALPDKPFSPCRTYFSRGQYGSLKTDSETRKVGWAYNSQTKRVHLPNDNEKMNILRCIRDENMIGDITGRLKIADNENLRRGDLMQIELNFSSMTSVIRNVTLKLCYTDSNGDNKEVELSNEGLYLNGTTLRQTINRQVPLSISVDGFMSVKAILRNAAGIERTFETPIRIVPQTYASISLLPSEYKGWPRKTLPLLITASHSSANVTHWTLRVTTPDQRVCTIPIDDLMNGNTYSSIIIPYYPGWDGSTKYWQQDDRDWTEGSSTDNPSFKTLDQTLLPGTYTFQLEVDCNSKITRSEEVSMDVLKVNFDPMQEFFTSPPVTYEASDIASYVWDRIMIEGLDFASGDFIETDMNVSRCLYIPVRVDPSDPDSELDNSKTVGLDELISFGLTDITWSNWLLSLQFPAVNAENASRRMLDFVLAWDVANNGYKGINYDDFDKSNPLCVRLDKEGVYYNNNQVDLGQWPDTMQAKAREVLSRLTGAKTLYIGSTDPYNHRSRAIYRFVRVVHNGQYSSTSDGRSNFENDPVSGGNL